MSDLPSPAPGSDRTHGVRLLFVGRVIRTKGVRDAVRALALLPHGVRTAAPEVAAATVHAPSAMPEEPTS